MKKNIFEKKSEFKCDRILKRGIFFKTKRYQEITKILAKAYFQKLSRT